MADAMMQHVANINRRAAGVVAAASLGLLLLAPSVVSAAEWIEVKTAHFTVVSNHSERGTRKLVWQLEQMRNAMVALWPWAKVDLNKPLTVILVQDQNSMRALAPQYWEQRGGIRPGSLWVTGPDQHYLVARADVEVDDQARTNPYISAYFSYVGLVLDQSLDRDLPFWFRRGVNGVLSNTLIQDDKILLGPIINHHLETLRDRPRLLLPQLIAVTRQTPQVKQNEFMQVYDAQAWAFVHFLMFSDQGKRGSQLDAFINLVSAGKDPSVAFTEALGPVEGLVDPFQRYFQQHIFAYRQINVDVTVEREKFPVRRLTSAETASLRAMFHAAMQRPVESRAAIADARKEDPNAAATYAAEGLLFDYERKEAEAKTAFAKAVELKTTSAYAYYRLASFTWQPSPSKETLATLDGLLANAIAHNPRYAAAAAWLGDLRASQGSPSGMAYIRRAIELEPRESSHRLRAARILLVAGKPAEARVDAEAALALADDDAERQQAQQLLDRIAKAQAGPPR